MFDLLIAPVGAVLLAVVATGIAFVLGMRTKSPLVLGPIVRLSRAIFNPLQMRTAGSPGAYAAIIRHLGRVSGRAYETPIGAVATDDGFVIALPYGSRTQWLRNVVASGSAVLVHEGRTFRVDTPEIVPIEREAARFSASDRRSFRLLAVDRCLRLRSVEPTAIGRASGIRSEPLALPAGDAR